MADDDGAVIVIKKKKGGGGDGHHGGAWKVAYADFVTAMMAFFLLMWLLSATTEEQRNGIADYFAPRIPISETSAGGASVFGGDNALSQKSMAKTGTGGENDAPRKGEGEMDGVRAAAPDPAKVDPFMQAIAHARAELEFKEAKKKRAEAEAEAARQAQSAKSEASAHLKALEASIEAGDVAGAARALVALEQAIEEALPGPLRDARREAETEAQEAAVRQAVEAEIDQAVEQALAEAELRRAGETPNGRDLGFATGDALEAGGSRSAEDFKVSDREALEKALQDPNLTEQDRAAMIAAFEAIEDADEDGELLQHLVMRVTPEGLLIEIAETAKTPLFASGSATPSDVMTALMSAIAPAIGELENKVAIVGHTDAKPFAAGSRRSNWTLSADRADAARRLLVDSGLAPERLARISGSADRDPLSEDPFAPENRRIGLTLLRGASKRPAPPAPASSGTPDPAPSSNGDVADQDI